MGNMFVVIATVCKCLTEAGQSELAEELRHNEIILTETNLVIDLLKDKRPSVNAGECLMK